MWTRAGATEQRLARRARVILCCTEGLPIREVGERCGLSQISVFKWKRRFLEMRLDGLADEKRRGRPASISAAQHLSLIDLATTRPRKGKTSWSVRDLAQASGLSATTVHRILSEGKLKAPQDRVLVRQEPRPRVRGQAGGHPRPLPGPPENALVLSVDEKSGVQALDDAQPQLPLRSGESRRLSATYKRNGATCLLAALSVYDGSSRLSTASIRESSSTSSATTSPSTSTARSRSGRREGGASRSSGTSH
jgi:putative transposase